MTENGVLEAIMIAVRQETDDPAAEITFETTASDMPGWDSLAHVRIILNVEIQLGISIKIGSTYGAANVGELVQVICKIALSG